MGNSVAMSDPRPEAIAEKASSPNPLAAAEGGNVSVTNSRRTDRSASPSPSARSVQFPGPISWASNCTETSNQATIPAGQTNMPAEMTRTPYRAARKGSSALPTLELP